MTSNHINRLFAMLAVLLVMSTPKALRAEDLIVEHNPADATHFTTIQAAIDHAAIVLTTTPSASFRILVKADPIAYTGPIKPISNVPIIGDSTAGTFIDGGSEPLISLSGVTSVLIRNFTFRNALTGISVVNSSAIITNNVFQLGTPGTAVRVQGSPSTSIINNTFFGTAIGTAIGTDSDIIITNDIFASNSTAISTQISLTQLSYNDFFGNGSNGVTNLGANSLPNTLGGSADPLFVDSAHNDFHLQAGSPCANNGNPQFRNSFNTASDMGAYGGTNSDNLLTTVTGLVSRLTPPSTITLNWNPTTNTTVTAYRVYYGNASRSSSGAYNGTPQAAEGVSPLEVPKGTTSKTLVDFPVTVPAKPAAPQLTAIAPLNQALQLSWTTVPSATGYRIYFSTASFDATSLPTSSFDVDGGTTSFRLTGLTNGTTYFVAVAALAQTRLFAAVTAVIDRTIASSPGSANESPYSQETIQPLGEPQVSDLSNVMSDFPEPLAPFPNLKNEGCFIATAAYGYYSAPQVQALRDFRDRYLLTSAPGRAFVAWYYRYGPLGAHYINAHPWLKPPVRVALFPLVCGSMLLLNTSTGAKIALLLGAALAAVLLVQRKKLSAAGGLR